MLLDDGHDLAADAVVVATGLPAAGHDWAPEGSPRSPFFVPDPWAPGALDVVRRDRVGPGDVLLVGAGLTMVDVVLSLTRPGGREDRRVLAVSRSGEMPARHADELQLAAIPDVDDWGSTLAELRAQRRRARRAGARDRWRLAPGHGRPALPRQRALAAALGGGPRRVPRLRRQRLEPRSATGCPRARPRCCASSPPPTGCDTSTGTVADAVAADAAAACGSRSRTARPTTWAGWSTAPAPRLDVRRLGNPLLDDLLAARGGVSLAQAATAGMGFRTRDGRLVDSTGRADAPVWTLGALRRGELWESTAVPEIRSQALGPRRVDVLDAVAPLPRRLEDGRLVSGHHPVARPRDPLGPPAVGDRGGRRALQRRPGAA